MWLCRGLSREVLGACRYLGIGCLAARLVLRPGDCLCRNDEGLAPAACTRSALGRRCALQVACQDLYQLSLPSASRIPCFLTRRLITCIFPKLHEAANKTPTPAVGL